MVVHADPFDRARIVRAVRTLQLQVVGLGIAFTVLTSVGVLVFHAPRAGIAVVVPLGVLIVVWGGLWYGRLATAVRDGEAILAVVITRSTNIDHSYLVAQPIDGSPARTFVVPSRHRVRDGEPTTMTGDRTSGRLVLASATAVSIPLRPAHPDKVRSGK